jgi:transcriptional regulator with PAS, ATPase and Fis domain
MNYRKKAFAVYPHKCNICGYDAYMKLLEVHHKDGNKKNDEIENLEILCITHHREKHIEEFLAHQRKGVRMAKEQGRYKGRLKKLKREQLIIIKEKIMNGEKKSKIAKEFGVSRATLYTYMKDWKFSINIDAPMM